MTRSTGNLRLEMPSPDLLREEALALIAERGGPFDGALRIVLTRGGRRLLLTEPLPPRAESIRLGVVTYSPPRILDSVKSLSYAGNMLAGRLARERGFDEALLVTPHGRVLEAPTSSIFWVDQSGTLCTPPLDEHILESITRDRVLALVDVEERSATVEDVQGAAEAFLASTIREVQPIAAIEDRELPAGAGERTREAAQALRGHIEEELRAVSA
jgi:branched-chain amino acid aminotransferase